MMSIRTQEMHERNKSESAEVARLREQDENFLMENTFDKLNSQLNGKHLELPVGADAISAINQQLKSIKIQKITNLTNSVSTGTGGGVAPGLSSYSKRKLKYPPSKYNFKKLQQKLHSKPQYAQYAETQPLLHLNTLNPHHHASNNDSPLAKPNFFKVHMRKTHFNQTAAPQIPSNNSLKNKHYHHSNDVSLISYMNTQRPQNESFSYSNDPTSHSQVPTGRSCRRIYVQKTSSANSASASRAKQGKKTSFLISQLLNNISVGRKQIFHSNQKEFKREEAHKINEKIGEREIGFINQETNIHSIPGIEKFGKNGESLGHETIEEIRESKEMNILPDSPAEKTKASFVKVFQSAKMSDKLAHQIGHPSSTGKKRMFQNKEIAFYLHQKNKELQEKEKQEKEKYLLEGSNDKKENFSSNVLNKTTDFRKREDDSDADNNWRIVGDRSSSAADQALLPRNPTGRKGRLNNSSLENRKKGKSGSTKAGGHLKGNRSLNLNKIHTYYKTNYNILLEKKIKKFKAFLEEQEEQKEEEKKKAIKKEGEEKDIDLTEIDGMNGINGIDEMRKDYGYNGREKIEREGSLKESQNALINSIKQRQQEPYSIFYHANSNLRKISPLRKTSNINTTDLIFQNKKGKNTEIEEIYGYIPPMSLKSGNIANLFKSKSDFKRYEKLNMKILKLRDLLHKNPELEIHLTTKNFLPPEMIRKLTYSQINNFISVVKAISKFPPNQSMEQFILKSTGIGDDVLRNTKFYIKIREKDSSEMNRNSKLVGENVQELGMLKKVNRTGEMNGIKKESLHESLLYATAESGMKEELGELENSEEEENLGNKEGILDKLNNSEDLINIGSLFSSKKKTKDNNFQLLLNNLNKIKRNHQVKGRYTSFIKQLKRGQFVKAQSFIQEKEDENSLILEKVLLERAKYKDSTTILTGDTLLEKAFP